MSYALCFASLLLLLLLLFFFFFLSKIQVQRQPESKLSVWISTEAKGNFRVPLTLAFKTRLRAKPLF